MQLPKHPHVRSTLHSAVLIEPQWHSRPSRDYEIGRPAGAGNREVRSRGSIYEQFCRRNVAIQSIEPSFQIRRFRLSDDKTGRIERGLVAIILFVIATMQFYLLHAWSRMGLRRPPMHRLRERNSETRQDKNDHQTVSRQLSEQDGATAQFDREISITSQRWTIEREAGRNKHGFMPAGNPAQLNRTGSRRKLGHSTLSKDDVHSGGLLELRTPHGERRCKNSRCFARRELISKRVPRFQHAFCVPGYPSVQPPIYSPTQLTFDSCPTG